VSADPEAVSALWDRGSWAMAAQAVGVAQRLLDLTVAYVSEREQFGRPVGVNQAVKHHCSNMAIAIEFARPMVQTAAWALSTGRMPEGTVPPGATDGGPSTAASMAKALASEAVDLACRSALQCHGAIGYTIEYDLQLWLKRGWALSASWGDARRHRRRIADGLGLVSA
ncbi:MAG: acyl-CoA dehydrogenase family protein, partial [Acidimicrobiales bacterium]|nr:acyl-CoA dehydrogenase family protein [Acidimicrobiales bacterium]